MIKSCCKYKLHFATALIMIFSINVQDQTSFHYIQQRQLIILFLLLQDIFSFKSSPSLVIFIIIENYYSCIAIG
jgi:hypothetical protein